MASFHPDYLSILDIASSDVCGFSATIPYEKYELPVNVSGFYNLTCGDVKGLAFHGIFDSETCPIVAESVNGTCCTDFNFYLWYVHTC